MNQNIKKLFELAKDKKLKRATEKTLKDLGFNEGQIQEIINEFATNQPHKIWKCGDCPNCGSGVDSSYADFDSIYFRSCDCPHDFYGSEAENVGVLISLT